MLYCVIDMCMLHVLLDEVGNIDHRNEQHSWIPSIYKIYINHQSINLIIYYLFFFFLIVYLFIYFLSLFFIKSIRGSVRSTPWKQLKCQLISYGFIDIIDASKELSYAIAKNIPKVTSRFVSEDKLHWYSSTLLFVF